MSRSNNTIYEVGNRVVCDFGNCLITDRCLTDGIYFYEIDKGEMWEPITGQSIDCIYHDNKNDLREDAIECKLAGLDHKLALLETSIANKIADDERNKVNNLSDLYLDAIRTHLEIMRLEVSKQ